MSLKRNTAWNLLGTGTPLLVAAVAIPFIIRMAGVEAFGVLTLIWALIGYFSLFDLGLGRALTQRIAAELTKGETDEIAALAKTGLLFMAVMGTIGGLILAFFADLLSTRWLQVSEALQEDTFRALLIASVGIALTTLTSGLRGVLEAYEDFKAINLYRVVLGVANFGLPALTVAWIDTSISWMVASLIAARLIAFAGHWVLVGKKLRHTWWSRGVVSKSRLNALLSFGMWMTVSNVISPLMVTADRFVISGVLGAQVVAYYTVPAEVLQRVLILPAALTAALFPRITALLHAERDEAWKLYTKSVRLVSVVMAVVCIALGVSAETWLTIWLTPEFAQRAWQVVVVLAIGVYFNSLAQVPFATVQASGNSLATARLHVIEAIFYLPVLVILLNQAGIVGAAMAWTLRTCIDYILLSIMVARMRDQKGSVCAG